MNGKQRHQAVLTATGYRVRRIADGELVGGSRASRSRALQAAADLDEATALCCRRCGCERINYERDALLVAGAVELRDCILILDGPAATATLDSVQLICAECGEQLDGVEWSETRSQHLSYGERSLSDDEALDALAAKLNESGAWSGADVCELVAELLARTGRKIEKESESGSPC